MFNITNDTRLSYLSHNMPGQPEKIFLYDNTVLNLFRRIPLAKVHEYLAFTYYILLIIHLHLRRIRISTLPLYFSTNLDLMNRKSILQRQQISLEKVRIFFCPRY